MNSCNTRIILEPLDSRKKNTFKIIQNHNRRKKLMIVKTVMIFISRSRRCCTRVYPAMFVNHLILKVRKLFISVKLAYIIDFFFRLLSNKIINIDIITDWMKSNFEVISFINISTIRLNFEVGLHLISEEPRKHSIITIVNIHTHVATLEQRYISAFIPKMLTNIL